MRCHNIAQTVLVRLIILTYSNSHNEKTSTATRERLCWFNLWLFHMRKNRKARAKRAFKWGINLYYSGNVNDTVRSSPDVTVTGLI